MKKFFLFIWIFVAATILAACGNGSMESDSGKGGITAQVIWPTSGLSGKSGAVLEKAPPEVRWVRMIVSNGTTTLTSSDFDTTLVSTGTLGGIPAGSGWTLTVQGLDNLTPKNILYQGIKTGITVAVSQTTNAGPVAMQVYAPSGSLDTSFSVDGKVTSSDIPVVGNHGSYKIAMVVQPDGKVIIAGDSTIRNIASPPNVFVARYNTDGTLDSSFLDPDTYANEQAGIVTRNTGSVSYAGSWVGDVIYQPDGKILVAGSISLSPTNSDFILMRFNSDGSVDTSITQGPNQWIQTDFGAGDAARAMAIRTVPTFSTGTIVVTGTSNTGGNDRLALALYTLSTGSLISKITTTVSSSISALSAMDVAFQADGKIVVAGQFTMVGGARRFGVVRFLSDGSTLDTSFNAGGTPGWQSVQPSGNPLDSEGANAITIQTDGKILIAGWTSAGAGLPQFGIIRFNPDGTLDTTFNAAGSLVPPGCAAIDINARQDTAYDIKVQPDGKIVVAGKSTNGLVSQFGIGRLNINGTIDTSFGNNGVLTVSFSEGVIATAMDIAPDGKIVLAGKTDNTNSNWAIARLWNNTTTKAMAYGVSGSVLGVISTITSTASTTIAGVYNVGLPLSTPPTALQGVTVNHLTNRLYASDLGNFTGTKVFVVDTISNRTLSAITVGTGPNGVLVNPDTNRLYVGLYGSGAGNTVSVIDTTDNTIATSIFGFSGPKGLALNSSGNRLYVGNTGAGTVSVVDTLLNIVIATIPGVIDPTSLKFDPNTNKLFATNNGNGTGTLISVINTLTNALVSSVTVSPGPVKMAIDPDAARLYVSNYGTGSGNLVSVISTTSNALLHTIVTGTGPNSIGIDTTSKKLYVDTLNANKIYVYDVANDAKNLIATMPGGMANIFIVP